MPYAIAETKNGMETSGSFRHRHQTISMTDISLGFSGIPLDEFDGNVTVSNHENHCLIVGASGMGKTRRIMFPTVLMSARAAHSMLILDVKGEIYKNTYKAVRSCGHDIRVVNLREPQFGSRYNPLELIRDYWCRGEKTRAITMLRDVASIVTKKFQNIKDAYWNAATEDAIVGFATLLLEHERPLTFASIHALFNEYLRHKESWDSLKVRFDKQAESYNCLSTVLSLTADQTVSCITSTFNAALSGLINAPAVRDLLSESDIDLKQVGRKATAIYVVLPDESEKLYNIASLLIDQLYSELIRLADSQDDGRLPVPVDFILDEFGSISGLDWTSKLAAGRSRRIRFTLAIQSISQLTDKYGENAAKTIIANCREWVYLGGRDIEFMNLLSWLSGEDENGKSVLSIRDLNEIETGSVLVLDGPKPYLGHLPDWESWRVHEITRLITKPRKPLVQNAPSLLDLISPARDADEEEIGRNARW